MAQQIVIKASEGHRVFGKLLKRVYRSDEHLVVERDGFPVAVLMSYQEYEKLAGPPAVKAFERFSRQVGEEVERQNLSEQDVQDEVKRAKREVYRERYGQQSG